MSPVKPVDPKDPDDYIAQIDDPVRRSEIEALDELIREEAPDLERHICAGMLGYGRYHYRYASGREGDSAVVALASQKRHISVYVSAADREGYLAERYGRAPPGSQHRQELRPLHTTREDRPRRAPRPDPRGRPLLRREPRFRDRRVAASAGTRRSR